MSTSTIAGYTAVTAGNLTDAAILEVEDSNGDSKKATLAQLRVQMDTNAHAPACGTAGAANTINRHVKATASIANNVATAVLTITVPNADHSSRIRVTLCGSLGAGGAVSAKESSAAVSYDIVIARTTGSNAVAAISSAYGAAGPASVAGAANITVTAAMSAVSGAVGAVNTFTLNATLARSGGSSDNHTCIVDAEVHNAVATGITFS